MEGMNEHNQAEKGFSIRTLDLDILRQAVAEIDQSRRAEPYEFQDFDRWRRSLNVPLFPVADEAEGIHAAMSDDVVTDLERIVTILATHPQNVPTEVFANLVRVAIELDRVEPFEDGFVVGGTSLWCRSRLGLITITFGHVGLQDNA